MNNFSWLVICNILIVYHLMICRLCFKSKQVSSGRAKASTLWPQFNAIMPDKVRPGSVWGSLLSWDMLSYKDCRALAKMHDCSAILCCSVKTDRHEHKRKSKFVAKALTWCKLRGIQRGQSSGKRKELMRDHYSHWRLFQRSFWLAPYQILFCTLFQLGQILNHSL